MSKNIEYGLNRLVSAGLGKGWSKYWQEEFDKRTPLLKKHFILDQFASYFLPLKEYFRVREKIEKKLTEEEWLWLIRHAGIIQGKIEYARRMRSYLPHLSEEDVHRKLRYKK